MGWACEGWNEALKTTEFPPRTMARILPLLTLGKGAQLAGAQVILSDGHGKFML